MAETAGAVVASAEDVAGMGDLAAPAAELLLGELGTAAGLGGV